MPLVRRPDRPISVVKNLHWLILHQAEVKRIQVEDYQVDDSDCYLTAYLTNGVIYECRFADRSVCFSWIMARRYLQGKPLNWFGDSITINKRNYRRV